MNYSVQYMNIFNKMEEDYFLILRKIAKKSKQSQRQMAEDLGFSLGKLNYRLKALQEKGLVKVENFKKKLVKLNYIYLPTPIYMSEKTRLTADFLKRKMKEYDELKKELKNILTKEKISINY